MTADDTAADLARLGEQKYVLLTTFRVLLAPCDQRGHRRGDDVAAVGVVETGPTAERVQGLVRAKYGLLARAIQMVARLRGRDDAAAVLISLASP